MVEGVIGRSYVVKHLLDLSLFGRIISFVWPDALGQIANILNDKNDMFNSTRREVKSSPFSFKFSILQVNLTFTPRQFSVLRVVMDIKQATFVKSSQSVGQFPPADRPEYAFTGRSNVGKSSLINYLCNRKNLAKTSSTPGKTQLVNHFLIDEFWYLVDLPGYGYAKVSKKIKSKFAGMIENYLLNRSNLVNVFVLIDSKIPPQEIDLDFIDYLGQLEIPFSIVFTKTDKAKRSEFDKNQEAFKAGMYETWEELPPMFYTSSSKKKGKEELLDYIAQCNSIFR